MKTLAERRATLARLERTGAAHTEHQARAARVARMVREQRQLQAQVCYVRGDLAAATAAGADGTWDALLADCRAGRVNLTAPSEFDRAQLRGSGRSVEDLAAALGRKLSAAAWRWTATTPAGVVAFESGGLPPGPGRRVAYEKR